MKKCKNCPGDLLLTDINCSLDKMSHFKYAKCNDCGKIYLYTKEDLLCIDVFGVSDQITMFNEFAKNMTNMEVVESRDINVAHNETKKQKIKAKMNSDVFEDDDDEYDELMITIDDDEDEEYVKDELVVVTNEEEVEEHECNCENCTCHDNDEDEKAINEFLESLKEAVKPPAASTPEMFPICEEVKNTSTEYAPYKEEPIVPQDIEHQIEAKAFGDYLIITDEFGDNDMITFTGSKDELNNYLSDLKLHSTPKVYMLKQLKIETVYKIQ